jgi:uncharacterized membrane protein YkoI
LATAALLLAVPCIAAAPYAMHLKVAAPAAVSNAGPTATAAAQATPPQSAQATSNVGDEPGLRAGQTFGTRTSSDATQEQRVKAEAQVNVGFAYQSGETQSQEEGIARKKLEMKRRMEEENLSPEQREAHRKMEYAEMAARTRRLAELSKAAKITMQQAIDAALRQQNGTVMESSLIGERTFTVKTAEGEVTTGSLNDGGLAKAMYRIVILFGDENSPQRAIVLVNAIDGTILRSVVE